MTQQTATIERPRIGDRSPRTEVPVDRQEDQRLHSALLEGDERALADAYGQWGQKVYRVAFGILRRKDLAEDVTQQVFVRLWQRPERFDPSRGSMSGFLQLDAHGRSIDLVRSERARADREIREHRLAASSEAPISTEQEIMRRLTSDRIQDALESLPADQRSPIVLAFFGGHSYRAVAEILGSPEGTIKSRIRVGISRLRVLLGDEMPEFA